MPLRRDAPVKELSSGDQRQVEIVMAIAHQPKVLLLDEPTPGLSRVETARVVAFCSGVTATDLNADHSAPPVALSEQCRIEPALSASAAKVGVLCVDGLAGVEHDMDGAFQLADTLSVLYMGAVVVTGDPQTVRANRPCARSPKS
jgi:branched-chain amino acid transport system ATP-binding protein